MVELILRDSIRNFFKGDKSIVFGTYLNEFAFLSLDTDDVLIEQ